MLYNVTIRRRRSISPGSEAENNTCRQLGSEQCGQVYLSWADLSTLHSARQGSNRICVHYWCVHYRVPESPEILIIVCLQKGARQCCDAIKLDWLVSGLVVEFRPAALSPGLEPRVGSPRIIKIDFHQQKLRSLSIACNVKLEGALYSVFCTD